MAPSQRDVRKQVYFHVGAPKTGSTYLQHVLWANRGRLAEAGVCYPLHGNLEHFPATMDVREMTWGEVRNPEWDGAWDTVAERIRSWDGPTAIFSNEILGGARARQAQRAVESVQPAEVHVIFTARDLARQLPSDWQEQVKHAHTVTLGRFVNDLVELGIDAPQPFGEMFWGLHDPIRVLQTWGDLVAPEHIHVVTVPPRGAARSLLWERFAGVLGLVPMEYESQVPGVNPSLGTAETEFLRRLNMALAGRAGRHYDPIVRVGLAEKHLSRRPDRHPPMLPKAYYTWALQRSEEMLKGIERQGFDVVGDLDDLLPLPREDEFPDAEDLPASALCEVAVDATTQLLVAFEEAQRETKRLESQLSEERTRDKEVRELDRSAEGAGRA